MPGDRNRPSLATGAAEENFAVDGLSRATLVVSPDIESACEAYVVLLFTPAGKYRRRVFLSLHSATAAVQ